MPHSLPLHEVYWVHYVIDKRNSKVWFRAMGISYNGYLFDNDAPFHQHKGILHQAKFVYMLVLDVR